MVYATTRWPHYDFEIFEALDKVRFGGSRIFLKTAVRHRLSAARLLQRILGRAPQLFQKLQRRDANLRKERVDITRDEQPDPRIFPGSSQACSPYRLVCHLCIFPSPAVGEFHETCSRPAKIIEVPCSFNPTPNQRVERINIRANQCNNRVDAEPTSKRATDPENFAKIQSVRTKNSIGQMSTRT